MERKYSNCQNFNHLKPLDSCHNASSSAMQKLWASSKSKSKKNNLTVQERMLIDDLCLKCKFFIPMHE
jgi:hypothetical protein